MKNVVSKYVVISNLAIHIKIASPLKRERYLVRELKCYVNLSL